MDKLDNILAAAANGDADALQFMRSFLRLAHQIDDVIDTPNVTKEYILRTFIFATSLFSLNQFYLRHREMLFAAVLTALNEYALSVEWENAPEQEKRQIADYARSSGGLRVIELCAALTGGIERMRDITPSLAMDSWRTHHDAEGKPI